MEKYIILFNPAPRSGFQAHRRVELPLSLLCTATRLDLQGYEIRIVDQFADPLWESKLTDALKRKPICFGVTSMTGPQILRALEASHRFKEVYPDVPVVWGGIHASLLPEQTLRNPDIDIVVVGEGEETFEDLTKAIESGRAFNTVSGIYYKDDGAIRCSTSRNFIHLDSEPPVSYQLVDINLYRRKLFGVDHITFNSSRGCTFRCSFCWDPVMHQRKWRAMQPRTVIDQLKRIIRDYDIRGFLFTDDHFFIDMHRAHGILEEIVRADLDIMISKLQIRADTICRMDREFLQLLVRAGVKRMTVGVESGSQRVLDLIKKDVSVEEVIQANQKLAEFPIVPLYLFMMGLPTETPDELKQSIVLAQRLLNDNPRAVKTFNIYTPYPGTELYDVALSLGLKAPDQLEDWSRFNFRNVPKESAWISPETKSLVENLDLPLMFLGEHFTDSYRKTNSIISALGKLYSPVALYRVKNMDVRFPLESKIVKSLGLFARQD
jgi:anaerobic magnesium-protoporphyrin IX monomethyl ester cyclase